jgi:hypothetical protein
MLVDIDARPSVRRPEYDPPSDGHPTHQGNTMDPIDDLRQRVVSAAGRDEGAMARTQAPIGRLIIQPTSMSRVVWRVSTDTASNPAGTGRQPRPV